MLRVFYNIIIFIMFFANISLADNLKKINIDGNLRITNETIIVFSDIKLDQNIKLS